MIKSGTSYTEENEPRERFAYRLACKFCGAGYVCRKGICIPSRKPRCTPSSNCERMAKYDIRQKGEKI